MIPVLVLTALVFGFLVFVAVRAPLQRRLALRNAVRRPTETALVVAGSLLGTALITGSFIVGDTLNSSIKATAYNQLGPIDEIVVVPEHEKAAELQDRIESAADHNIDGVLSTIVVPASLARVSGGQTRAEPEAQLIETNFDEARSFGDDPEATGISGPTPGTGEIAITQDLADTLDVVEEDDVKLFVYGANETFHVTRVLPRTGIAGFWLGFESTSPNAFVSPGTVDQLTGGKIPAAAVPPTTTLMVSNRGDVEEGATLTPSVTDTIEDALQGAPLRVEDVKRTRLDNAEEQGAQFSELFLGIGAFAIVAGILLLVNIFVMLSQERKGQLGMLRAIGLRRADLVRVFAIEGALYSVIASILGAFVGIGVGWAIAKLAAPIFGGTDEFALELRFAMDFESIVIGFCVGALITTVTILLTSVRISRINIIRAIRDLPEPPGRMTRKRTVFIGVAVAVLALGAFFSSYSKPEGWFIAIVGPPIAAFSLLPLLSRRVARRSAVMVVAGFSLIWGIFGNALTSNQFFESGEVFAFVTQGILLTFSAVVFLSQTAENFERLARPVAARNLPVRLGMAYPIARRFRTGLTLGMYGLVIFTMTFIATLAHVFGGQVEDTVNRASGGFDVVVTASQSNPPSPDVLEGVEGVESVSPLVYGGALFQPEGLSAPEDWVLTGIAPDFVATGPPALEDRDEHKYSSDAEVWDAVLADPHVVIIPEFFLQEGGGPPGEIASSGESLEIVDPITGKSVERKIGGVLSTDAAFNGVYMSNESAGEVLGDRAVASRYFIDTAGDDSEASGVAEKLQGTLFRNGVEADSFKALVEEFNSLNLQFFNLMQGYLALGLLVGIAGLGVVMVRAVRERRREIGVLRSLGFVPGQVRAAFLLESGFTAIQGILIGSALALVTSAQLIATNEFGESAKFAIPWLQLTILGVAAMIASILATSWPARQASHIAPAVALRVAE